MKYYKITFMTKKGKELIWTLHTGAPTAKEAIQKAKDMWNSDVNLGHMHMFHVKARALRDSEEFKYHYFKSEEA